MSALIKGFLFSRTIFCLKTIEKYFAKHVTKFLLGDRVTYVDFYIFDGLDAMNKLEPKLLTAYPHLQQYHQRIANLPKIAEYLKSDRSIQPLNMISASFH